VAFFVASQICSLIKTSRDLSSGWPMTGHNFVLPLAKTDSQAFLHDLYGKQRIDSNSHVYRMKCKCKNNDSGSAQKYMTLTTP